MKVFIVVSDLVIVVVDFFRKLMADTPLSTCILREDAA